MSLSVCQAKAAEAFLEFLDSPTEEVFVLTGGPGRGKSYLTEHLIELTKEHTDLRVCATATTNKAAAVLQDAINQDAETIHKLLRLRVRPDFKTGKEFLSKQKDAAIIYDSLIIIDEISMANTELLRYIEGGTVNCKFLFVGDKDQLAPVGEKNSPAFFRSYKQQELLTVMRQREGSHIITLAEQLKETILTGKFEPITADGVDVEFVEGAAFQEMVDQQFTSNYGKLNHSKIICWKNDTVNQYNDYVRQLHTDSETFEIDEIIVTNNPIMDARCTIYSIEQNATITGVREGYEMDIDGHWYELDNQIEVFQATHQEKVKSLLSYYAKEQDWYNYFKAKEFFADLRAIHACTAFKAQGSTYDTVFIDLPDIGDCRQWEQVARMLYVAITRAKVKVIIYGSLPKKYINGAFDKSPEPGNTEYPF